jgi:hypothetical protein
MIRMQKGMEVSYKSAILVNPLLIASKRHRALQFTRRIDATPMTLRRAKAIRREIGKGRGTGRVKARPFFVRTVKATAPAMHAAQLAVLRRELEAAVSAAA